MNFFLDENFPKSAITYLQNRQHTVFDIRSTEFEGAEDREIFAQAQEKQAIFLTTDKDFFHTVPLQFNEHFGIAVFALRNPNRDKILQKLEYFLDHFDVNHFRTRVVLFRDNRYSIY